MSSKMQGSVEKGSDGFKVTFDRLLDHDIETVWEAITDPTRLKYWFTDIEMDFRKGGKIKIIFRDAGQTVTNGEIIEIEKPNRFVWTWEGEYAEWLLSKEGKNKCRLIFTYSKMSDQYAVGAAGGFHTLLQRLEAFLDGDKTTYPFGTEEFDEQQAEIREQYGQTVFAIFPELESYNPIRIEKILKAPVASVWSALTERQKLKKWYFNFPETFVLIPGQQFEWKAGPSGGKQWLHRGIIKEIVENKKLVHSWEYPGFAGISEVSWELESTADSGTKLVLTHKFIVPFDPKEDALRRKNFITGWKQILQNLIDFIKVNT